MELPTVANEDSLSDYTKMLTLSAAGGITAPKAEIINALNFAKINEGYVSKIHEIFLRCA